MEDTSSIKIENTQPIIPLVLDASYKGDEITQKVAKILALDDIKSWSVIDHDPEAKLALVHYNDDADMLTYGDLRGILVDLETETVIADSFGYTPISVLSELKEKDGVITVKDKQGQLHVFNKETTSIKRVFEGVVIRAVWHKSKLYLITHRKIHPLRSRWGSSKSFMSMYEEANGPKAEDLFDTTKPFSNTTYNFLVVDSSLLVGTRQKVSKPYLVFLAQRDLEIGRPKDQVACGKANFKYDETIGGSVNESFIHKPKLLTLDEANQHLKYGYYNPFDVDDERQLTGEAVIMYEMENGLVKDIVKVHSPSYEWRSNLRGNNPNINHQFYSLLNMVYPDITTDDAWKKLNKDLIMFPLYSEKSLKDLFSKSGGILMIPTDKVSSDLLSRESRIHLLWINYVLSLPTSLQLDALNILANFKKDRNDVTVWIQELESKHKDIESVDLPRRVKSIITSSRHLARERMTQGTNRSSYGSYMKLPVLIKSTIRNLINKENGTSLYGLIRDMKHALNPKPETKEVKE